MREFTPALHPQADAPLYEQLTEYIIAQIRAGRMPSGEKLPSVRALCAHLHISRSTVEAAYQILAAEGYIEGRARSGNYVRPYEHAPLALGQPPSVPQEAQASSYPHNFSTGQVDTAAFPYQAWAKLYKGVLQDGSGLLLRGHAQGDEVLRSALSEFLLQYRGVLCAAEQLVLGAGVDHLLGMLLILFGEGAVYALEDPGYPANFRTLQHGGRKFVSIPLDESGMLDGALDRSCANVAYVTPSHQFPTGITMPAGRRAKLLSWANADAQRYIIEDDYDSEFRYITRPIPAMQGMDPRKVIYIGTFNRSLAPSIRVAYMVLPPNLLGRFREKFAHAACSVSRFEQQTLARFLREGHYQRHLRRMSGVYRRRRDTLLEEIGKIGYVHLSGHEAGLHCLLTHEHLSETELLARARGGGVQLRGLSEYVHGGVCRKNTLVLGYGGLDEGQIRCAAQILREVWNDCLPAHPERINGANALA